MNLIKKINKILEWSPENIFYTTPTEYLSYRSSSYTRYNHTELGEFMEKLPILLEIFPKLIYYVISYLLYYTFIKIPWWIFTGLFIPKRFLK